MSFLLINWSINSLIASGLHESFSRVHCLDTLMRKVEINDTSLLKEAVKRAAALFLWSKKRVTAELPKVRDQFLMLNFVGFLCGKYFKTVWCIWLLCVAVTEKLECTWSIFDKRRDACVEILCNSLKADFKGTVEV